MSDRFRLDTGHNYDKWMMRTTRKNTMVNIGARPEETSGKDQRKHQGNHQTNRVFYTMS